MQVIYLNQYFDNNENLESNLVENKVKVLDTEFFMYTDNGVFNKKGLDFGTRVLLENLEMDNKYSFLDVGCGCGPIGFYVLLNRPDSVVDMIDVNNRAIKLTKMGLKKNHISAEVFIITNPPIHVGKNKVYEIIRGAKDHLNNNGELWIVIRKDQGAKSLVNDNSDIFEFEIINKIKGFWVIKSKIK